MSAYDIRVSWGERTMKNGLIGYMFQDRPKNWFQKIWWKVKGYFGWKNRTGIPIVVSDKVKKDYVLVEHPRMFVKHAVSEGGEK